MANPHRGEVAFEAGGQQWTLVYSVNALAELEEELDLSTNEIAESLKDAKKVRIRTLRAVIWAGLLERHPEIDIKRAGELLADLKISGSMELIVRGFALAFPDSEGKGADPQQPGGPINGIGPASIESGAESVVTKKRSGEKHHAKSL